jgi:hypothetical protein
MFLTIEAVVAENPEENKGMGGMPEDTGTAIGELMFTILA